MARSRKQSSPRSIVLHRKVAIEVTRCPSRRSIPSASLDVARLSRAQSARFELGYFDAGCCRRILSAVVRKGQVVKLELEACKEGVRMTPS
jgi:hypothetical protein